MLSILSSTYKVQFRSCKWAPVLITMLLRFRPWTCMCARVNELKCKTRRKISILCIDGEIFTQDGQICKNYYFFLSMPESRSFLAQALGF